MKTLFGTLTTACLVASAPALGQSSPTGMKLHRSQAGTLDSAGWTEATSTEGAFSVELPCNFNDFTVHADEAVVTDTFVVGCKLADGRKFSASRIAYRNGETGARQLFDTVAKDGLWPGARTVKAQMNGVPALQIDLTEGGRCAWGRMLRAGADNLLMIVEADGETCTVVKPDADRFVNSVKAQAR